MKLTYGIAFEDFRTLQPHFTIRAGNNAGFKAALAACGLIGLLGGFLLIEGAGLPVGLFLIGLGVAAATAAYFYERHSVRAKEREYEKKLSRAFQQIHCRGQRNFEADDNAFTTSCKCGTVTRPWSELTSFSESDTHFVLNTKTGGQTLPKSAFSSPAEVAEFRALVSGKLNEGKAITSPHFDFLFKQLDYRAAYWLHVIKGGGWRGLVKILATYACIASGAFVLWNAIATHNEAVRAGFIGALIAFPLLRAVGKRRKIYLGPLRVHFGAEGLHIQYPSTQSRKRWSDFIGYLEDRNVLLLYVSSKGYSIVPKRSLTGQATKFQCLVTVKLGKFDYRNPARAVEKLEVSPGQSS